MGFSYSGDESKLTSSQGGQQEDAEEFLGFYLDALEDELLSITNALAPPQPTQAAPQAAETGPQDAGWMEVGKRNRHAVTRTVSAIPLSMVVLHDIHHVCRQ